MAEKWIVTERYGTEIRGTYMLPFEKYRQREIKKAMPSF